MLLKTVYINTGGIESRPGSDEKQWGDRNMQSSTIEDKRSAIIRMAHSILEKRSFKEAAHAVFESCRELTGAQSGYVALLSRDGNENEVLFLESGGLSCSVDPELPMPIRGLRGDAYKMRKTVCENDFMNSPWVQHMPAGHVELRNVIFAPLCIEQKAVGVIGLANKPSDFSEEDVKLVTVLGELVAIALENSRLIERLDNITKDLFVIFREQ